MTDTLEALRAQRKDLDKKIKALEKQASVIVPEVSVPETIEWLGRGTLARVQTLLPHMAASYLLELKDYRLELHVYSRSAQGAYGAYNHDTHQWAAKMLSPAQGPAQGHLESYAGNPAEAMIGVEERLQHKIDSFETEYASLTRAYYPMRLL